MPRFETSTSCRRPTPRRARTNGRVRSAGVNADETAGLSYLDAVVEYVVAVAPAGLEERRKVEALVEQRVAWSASRPPNLGQQHVVSSLCGRDVLRVQAGPNLPRREYRGRQ